MRAPRLNRGQQADSQPPPDVWRSVAAYLLSNDVATDLRVTSKDLKESLNEPRHATVDLSKPLSTHGFAMLLARWGAPGATDRLPMRKRRVLLSKAAASGDIGALQLLSDRMGCALGVHAFDAAVTAGQLRVCKWMLKQGHMEQLESWSETMTTAASAGQQAVVEWVAKERVRGESSGHIQHCPLPPLVHTVFSPQPHLALVTWPLPNIGWL